MLVSVCVCVHLCYKTETLEGQHKYLGFLKNWIVFSVGLAYTCNFFVIAIVITFHVQKYLSLKTK